MVESNPRRRPETTNEFMARRNREVAARSRGEAAAHDAYGTATRSGWNPHLPTTDDVLAFGARLNRNRFAVGAAGALGQVAGFDRGVRRGAVHMAEDLWDGTKLVARLTDPYDALRSAPGQSAAQQVFSAGKSAVGDGLNYVRRAVADPTVVAKDLNRAGRKLRRDLDPTATPTARTALGEFTRRSDIAANQGELAFNVGAAALGAPEIKVFGGVVRGTKAAKYAKYIKQGRMPELAEYLSEPYVGDGAHYISKKFFKENFGDGPVVRRIRDSSLNVSIPRDITRGDFYEHHFRTDPRMYGARLPNWSNPRGWSGKRLGLEKFGPVGRAVLGAPDALQSTVGGGLGGVGWTIGDLQAGEDER